MYVNNDGNDGNGGDINGDGNGNGDGDGDQDDAAAADGDDVNEDDGCILRTTIGQWQLDNNNGPTMMRW